MRANGIFFGGTNLPDTRIQAKRVDMNRRDKVPDELEELLQDQTIAEFILRYAQAIDRRDVELLASVFIDAMLHHGTFEHVAPAEAATWWDPAGKAAFAGARLPDDPAAYFLDADRP